ncbi:MAG: UDP-N-acetylmuramate dehydrogenase [Chitinispirillaceae bacterium]
MQLQNSGNESEDIFENVPLREKTTYRIGGRARFYAEPKTERQIIELLALASERKLPVFVLGRGSNVLVSDKGWDGLVINLSRFSEMKFDGCTANVQGGVLLDSFVAEAVRNGCGGIEELSGIPGTVGGAVVMNAGAFSTCIADTFRSAKVLNITREEIAVLKSENMRFGYRDSAVKECGDIVLSATFEFSAVDSEKLFEIRKNILCRRKGKQPLEYPNCGSVFKRPPGNFAGTLIEMCGLKGYREGDVEISPKHANFIVNRGEGHAEDVRRVVRHVQKTVHERFDVLLEPEVIFVGQFDEPLYTPFFKAGN